MRRPQLGALALVALLACALTGCVRVDRAISLDSDGAGTYKVAVGFSDRLIQGGGASFTNQMAACEARVTSEGGSAARADDGTYTTWTFVWRFADVAALNTLLKRGTTFCQAPGAPGVAQAASTDPVEVTERARLLTTTFVVRGHVSLDLSQSGVNLQDPAVAALVKDARTSFAVTMPLWVTSYTPGAAVNGATITYTVHAGESANFEVVGGGPTALGIAAALVAGAAVLGVLLIMVRLMRRRRRARARREEQRQPAGVLSPS